jgi:sugar lactone lactonase YvrE
MKRRNLMIGGTLVGAIALLAVGQATLEGVVRSQTVEAPLFQVDPYWPKPIPNGWLYGTVIGVATNAADNVFIVHRQNITANTEDGAQQDPPIAECCSSAPPVLQFDPAGNLVRAWGGPVEGAPYVWPASNHGLAVDDEGNVWIGGNGGGDSHVLKFTEDGQYLATYGEPGQETDSNSLTHFSQVADISFDIPAREAFFADGYGNIRLAVVDMDSGEIKRYWGAYGNRPNDAYVFPDQRTAGTGWSADQHNPQQFRGPVHCVEPSVDGLLYVCDRQNNRVQVFEKDGTYVREAYYNPDTLGDGATWDISMSPDPEQSFFYVVDGKNARIHIVNRETMEAVSSVGTGGRYPGMFQAAHSIAVDSQGNMYITETYEGRRLHKFVFMGVGPAPRHQGAAWPEH